MLKHDIKLISVLVQETGQIQVEYTMDGALFSKVYANAQALIDQNGDLLQTPDDAARHLLFYFLATLNGDPNRLSEMVDKTLTIDVRNAVQQILAIS